MRLAEEVNLTVRIVVHLDQQLQEAINSPNENTQREVENSYAALISKLSSALSNTFSPGFRSQLDELSVAGIRVSDLVGLGLVRRVNAMFDGGYTSVKTLDEIHKCVEQVQALSEALKAVISRLSGLGVSD